MEDGSPLDDFVVEIPTDTSITYKVLSRVFKLLFIWQSIYNISDTALESLLNVVKKILLILNELIKIEMLNELTSAFPKSLYKVRKLVGINRDLFQKFAVCKKCDSTYTYDDATELINGMFNYFFFIID